MAQILKFAGGGSTPSTSWGTLTIDNVTYNMDDTNIQRLYDHAKTLDPDVAYQFDFIINELKSGKNLSYSNNKLDGGVDFDINNRKAKRIENKPARGFGKERDVRQAISSLSNLSLVSPDSKVNNLNFNDRYVEYSRDDKGDFTLNSDGNKQYINSANNQDVIDFLNNIQLYSTSNRDLTITGLGERDGNYIRNWYNNYGSENFNALIGRIKNGNWTNEDVEILNDLNISLGQPLTSEQQSRKTQYEEEQDTERQNQIYSSAGFSPQDQNIVFDAQSNTFKFASPELATYIASLGNAVWLNDDFAVANPGYSFLLNGHDNGIFVINGEIFDGNDPRLLENNIFKQFVEDNKVNPRSNNIIKQYWTDASSDDWRWLNEWNNQIHWNNLPIDNQWVRDITGNYSNQSSLIFQVLPTNVTDEMYDQFGRLKPEYYQYLMRTNVEGVPTWTTFNRNPMEGQQRSSDLQRNNYYSNFPRYLSQLYTNGNLSIVDFGGGLYYNPNNKKYYWTRNYGDGTYIVQLKNYIVGQNPNNYIERGAYGEPLAVDFSSLGITDNSGKVVSHKKGGKIFKASEGLKMPWELKSEARRNHLYNLLGFQYNLNPDNSISDRLTLRGINTFPTNLSENNIIDTINENNLQSTTSNLYPDFIPDINLSNPSSSNDTQYGSNEQSRNKISLNPEAILAPLDLAVSLWGNKKVADKQNESILHATLGSIKQNAQEFYPIYTDNGISRQYDQRIAALRNYNPISSDMNQYNSQILSRDAMIDQIQAEKNSALSQSIDKYNSDLLNKMATYGQMRSEIENENRRTIGSGLAQYSLTDANKANTATQSVKNFIYNIRENAARDLEMLQGIDMMNVENRIAELAKSEWDKNYNFDMIEDETLRNTFKSQGNWLEALRYLNPQLYRQYYTQALEEIRTNPKYRHDWTNLSTMQFKKGGKTKPIWEQILLLQNKYTHRASENLSRDIIKLFMKLMK